MAAMGQMARIWVDWLIRTNCQAAVVVAAVLLVQWLFQRQLPPRWRYGLWALVMLRLLMPNLPASRFSVFNLAPAESRPPTAIVNAQLRNSSPPISASPYSAAAMPMTSPDVPPSRPLTLDWRIISSGVWLAGVLLLGAALLWAHARMRRRVMRTAKTAEPQLLKLLEQCREQIRLRRKVTVIITDAVTTPALMGLWRPRLLLPPDLARTMSPDELRFVFLHEMAHLKCNDIAADWLLALLRLVHWFNPVIWCALGRCRADRELARDVMVLAVTGRQHEQSYGQTILRLVERLGQSEPAIGAVGILEGAAQLKRRLRMIAGSRPNAARGAVLAVALLVIIGCSTLTGRKAEQDDSVVTLPAPAHIGQPPPSAVDMALSRRCDQLVLDGVAFADVISQLAKSTEVPIVVDWRELEGAGVTRQTPVSARLRNMTYSRVLLLVLREAAGGPDLSYTVQDGVITITTRAARLGNAPVQIYDICDLLDAPDAKTNAAQLATIIDIVKLVQEDWAVTGPPKEVNGQLVVKTLEENHKQIAAFLDKLRETRGIVISVEMRLLSVPEGFLTRLKDQLGGEIVKPLPLPPATSPATPAAAPRVLVLDDQQLQRLLDAARDDRDAKVISSPRLAVFNGQEAVVTTGSETPYISSIKVVTNDEGKKQYVRQTEQLLRGIRIEVQPTISADRKFVTVHTKARLTDLLKMDEIPFKDAPADKKLYTQLPRLNVRELDAVVSVPDAGTLLLSGFHHRSGDEPADGGKRGGDTLLLLKPTIIIRKPADAGQSSPLLPAK